MNVRNGNVEILQEEGEDSNAAGHNDVKLGGYLQFPGKCVKNTTLVVGVAGAAENDVARERELQGLNVRLRSMCLLDQAEPVVVQELHETRVPLILAWATGSKRRKKARRVPCSNRKGSIETMTTRTRPGIDGRRDWELPNM